MRATGVSCQEVLMLTGGEYMPTESRASWAAPSRPEAGSRPSQQERRRLQPTADSVCRGSWGMPGACRASQISLVAPAQPLIASTCVRARCQQAHCKGSNSCAQVPCPDLQTIFVGLLNGPRKPVPKKNPILGLCCCTAQTYMSCISHRCCCRVSENVQTGCLELTSRVVARVRRLVMTLVGRLQ